MTSTGEFGRASSAAEALALSERLRAEVERIAQVGSWEWDIATNRVTWSAELFRIFGLAVNTFEPTYEGYVSRLHPDDRDRVAANVRHALESGVSFMHTHRVVHDDGAVHIVLGRGEVVLDESGKPARMVGTTQDITERVALERETAARLAAESARDRAEFLAEVGDALARNSLDFERTLKEVASLAVPRVADWCAVDLVEPDGSLRRVSVNHVDHEKIRLVQQLADRYPEDRTSPYGAYEVLRTGLPQHGEVSDELVESAAVDAEHARLIRALGLRSYVVAPLVGRDGVIGTITLVNDTSRPRLVEADFHVAMEIGRRAGVAIDNARLHRSVLEARELLEQQALEMELQALQLEALAAESEAANEELHATTEELMQRTQEAETALEEALQARADAESANSAKAEFLANMSHELRTPINAALGYSELLAMGVRGPVTTAQLEDLARIKRSQRLLLSLVNDILNFARLEAGQIEYHFADVDLVDVLSAIEAMISPQVNAKGVLYRQQGCAASVTLRADMEKLQQVMLNLLTNAVKFTDAGGSIELICSADDDWVDLMVRDTGRGIAADQLERVFEPFVQVDRHLTHISQQGVGLGLAISRDLVRGMGGDLRVDSKVGKGSTFVVRLPRGT
ncbi:MAG: ATP-binding region ATPase domain protein [Gemmatimonadetes bacterium]|nr:ATP-binding region ATPase domain protein [Gemmatimonadota bacterium]